MRDLKRKSIVERLKVLKEATGSSNVDFEKFLELDDEFNPEEHDRLMQEAFNDDYYGEEEDMKKPQWDDDIGIIQAGKSKKSKKGKNEGVDEVIGMDADFIDDVTTSEKKLSKAEKKKLKKREKAKAKKQRDTEEIDDVVMDADLKSEEIISLDPSAKKEKMKKALDEYYGLDYEDMIGDQPTRFKYTQVPSSSYGLTPEEILLAEDEDLQGIVSLKRLQPYREGRSRPSDLNARIKEFRRKYQNRQEEQFEDKDDKEEKSKTKRMGKKERQRRKEAAEKKAMELSVSTVEEHKPAKKKVKKA